jgi:O-acetylhomoserine (thiol)-lyase
VQKHSENGLALAEWLEAQDQVAWVNPGLKSSKYYDLAKNIYQKDKTESFFWFKGRFEAAKTADETKIFSLLAT